MNISKYFLSIIVIPVIAGFSLSAFGYGNMGIWQKQQERQVAERERSARAREARAQRQAEARARARAQEISRPPILKKKSVKVSLPPPPVFEVSLPPPPPFKAPKVKVMATGDSGSFNSDPIGRAPEGISGGSVSWSAPALPAEDGGGRRAPASTSQLQRELDQYKSDYFHVKRELAKLKSSCAGSAGDTNTDDNADDNAQPVVGVGGSGTFQASGAVK